MVVLTSQISIAHRLSFEYSTFPNVPFLQVVAIPIRIMFFLSYVFCAPVFEAGCLNFFKNGRNHKSRFFRKPVPCSVIPNTAAQLQYNDLRLIGRNLSATVPNSVTDNATIPAAKWVFVFCVAKSGWWTYCNFKWRTERSKRSAESSVMSKRCIQFKILSQSLISCPTLF